MDRFRTSVVLAALLVAAAACGMDADRNGGERDSLAVAHDAGAPAAGSDAGEHDASHGADPAAPGDHAAAGHGAGEGEGQALLPIMQRLGSAMTALTYALMTDDHETVARNAAAIAAHAPISAEEIARIHAELGPDMAAFEAVDESTHVAATRLHDAARAQRLDAVVERLGDVQRNCVSCHVQFRERLRTTPAVP